MERKELQRLLELPEVQSAAVQGYEGPFALGITRRPDGEWVLRLRVGTPMEPELRVLEINELRVPLLVEGNAKPILPLRSSPSVPPQS